ncbi:MAG: hypothetical protein AB7O32_11595, partial [Vicinamibacterales bacterium]
MSRRLTSCIVACAVTAAVSAPSARVVQQSGERTTPSAGDAREFPQPSLPDAQRWLGTVTLPTRVTADGKPLAGGTYRVRLTTRHADDKAAGAAEELERWVEFVQGGQVKGQALASIVPAGTLKTVADSAPPAPGQFAVQRLAGNDYLRLWYNLRGDQVLIHLPVAGS